MIASYYTVNYEKCGITSTVDDDDVAAHIFFFLLIPSCSAHASAAAEDNKVVINCDYNYRVYGVFNHSIGEEGAVRLRLNQVNPNCVEHRSSLS